MSTSDPEFNWKKVEWNSSLGRGGFVPRQVKRLPLHLRQLLCKLFGHPLHSIEPFSWTVDDKKVSGHICAKCFQRVRLDRIC